MATKVFRAIAAALLVIVVALGALSALNGTVLGGALGGALEVPLNAALDATGVKGRVESALRDHAADIANATGLPVEQVNSAIDDLDISSWSVGTLPGTAVERGSVSTAYDGTDVTVTTYDDPGYLTVDAFGQSLTLEVPESAQSYLSLLSYLP